MNILARIVFFCSLVFLSVAVYGSTISLDPTFNGTGISTVDFGTGYSGGYSVVIQTDGKIVSAGYASNGLNNDFALVRYNVDGTLDSSFGTNGKVITDFASDTDAATSVIIQPDGKIVAAGMARNGLNYDFALIRYNTDGSLDSSFGTGGKVITTFGSGDEAIKSIKILADGKILVGGAARVTAEAPSDFALARYNVDGSLDASFGTGGKVLTDVSFPSFLAPGHDGITSLAIQPDGMIIAAGAAVNFLNLDFAVVRYNANGIQDTSFGIGGRVLTNSSLGFGAAAYVVVQPDGKIVIAGAEFNLDNSDSNFALIRYNSNGSLDSSFGAGGKVITDFGFEAAAATSLALQTDGKLVVVGFVTQNQISDMLAVRYNDDGVLDSSFGMNGKVLLDISSGGADAATDVKLDESGRIIIVGESGRKFTTIRLANSAAPATARLGGTVTDAKGRGVYRALVVLTDQSGRTQITITNMSGRFSFNNLPIGETYTVRVISKRHRFTASIQHQLTGDYDGLRIVASSSR